MIKPLSSYRSDIMCPFLAPDGRVKVSIDDFGIEDPSPFRFNGP